MIFVNSIPSGIDYVQMRIKTNHHSVGKNVYISPIVFLLLAIAVSVIIIINGKSPAFPAAPLLPEIDSTYDYINSVKGHDEQERIVGVFNGKEVDTLYVTRASNVSDEVDVESHQYYWNIISARKTVPALQVFGLCPKLVYEGDLDKNGRDEFGILDTWDVSALRNYRVYSFHKGEWRLLIPPIRTAESLRAIGRELVKPGENPGEVQVVFSDFNAPLSSFASAPDKDTILAVSFLEIEPLP